MGHKMEECWINVYKDTTIGVIRGIYINHTRQDAIDIAKWAGDKPIYRIHVKLKPNNKLTPIFK